MEYPKPEKPIFGDKLYQQRARIALPLLVRQAEAGITITCSRLQSSAGLRAIIGLFLLKLTDFIRPSLLTLLATMRAIIIRCAQSSVLLLTFPANERARKRRFS